LFYREVNRLTSVAEKFLQKRFHNKKDDEWILTGHMKPFSSTNATVGQSSEILFCSVKLCSEVASFKCNAVNGCRSLQFCTLHGPNHVQHESQLFKDAIDYHILRGQHNERLFDEAADRVRKKIEAKAKDEKIKKTIRLSKIAVIQKMVAEKDEQASVKTKSKMEEIEENIAKNAKFLKRVNLQCGKRSSSMNLSGSDSNNDVNLQAHVKHSHSVPNVEWDVYDLGSTVPINKKAKVVNGLSMHDNQLKSAVNRIISLANSCDNGRASKFVNFDVDIVVEINTPHYWSNLHKLIDIYKLPTDQETQKLMSGNFFGNSKESVNRRLNFIQRICQLLREANILTSEKVTSTRNSHMRHC